MPISFYIIGLLIVVICCETAELYFKINKNKNELKLNKKGIKLNTKHYLNAITHNTNIEKERDDNISGLRGLACTTNCFRISNIRLHKLVRRNNGKSEYNI